MKYAIVAVLLFMPLMAQENPGHEKGGYLWALDQIEAQERAQCKTYVTEAKVQAMEVGHKMLVEQIQKDNADYNELAAKYNRLLDAHEQLMSSYTRLASAPPLETVRTEYRYVDPMPMIPVEPQKNCVATSTPLGQSVITGVNCY